MFVNGFERTIFSRIWLKPLPTQFDRHRLGLDEVNFHRLLQVAILWISPRTPQALFRTHDFM